MNVIWYISTFLLGIAVGGLFINPQVTPKAIGPYIVRDDFMLICEDLGLQIILPDHQEKIEVIVGDRNYCFLFDEDGQLDATCLWNSNLAENKFDLGIHYEFFADRDLDGIPEEIVQRALVSASDGVRLINSSREVWEEDFTTLSVPLYLKRRVMGRVERVDLRVHKVIYEVESMRGSPDDWMGSGGVDQQ